MPIPNATNNAYDFSLVIPTKGSPKLLQRCIQYYQGWPVKIVVADTGEESLAKLFHNKPWFQYLHLPGLSYGDQLAHALSIIDTTYVQLIANDDFFLLEGLTATISFLRNNPHIGAARGRNIVLCQNGTRIDYREAHAYIIPDQFNQAAKDPVERLTQCWQIDWTYAMMPTATARMIYEEKDIPFEFGYLFEQAMEFKLLTSSNVYLVPVLTQVRYRSSTESINPSHAPAYREALLEETQVEKAKQLESLLLSFLIRFQYTNPESLLEKCLSFYQNLPQYSLLYRPLFSTRWAKNCARPEILNQKEDPSISKWTEDFNLPHLCRIEQLIRFPKDQP